MMPGFLHCAGLTAYPVLGSALWWKLMSNVGVPVIGEMTPSFLHCVGPLAHTVLGSALWRKLIPNVGVHAIGEMMPGFLHCLVSTAYTVPCKMTLSSMASANPTAISRYHLLVSYTYPQFGSVKQLWEWSTQVYEHCCHEHLKRICARTAAWPLVGTQLHMNSAPHPSHGEKASAVLALEERSQLALSRAALG